MKTSLGLRNMRFDSGTVFQICLLGILVWVIAFGALGSSRSEFAPAFVSQRSDAQIDIPNRSLTPFEQSAAKTAWAYIEANTQGTGFVNSVHGYPSTTLWDQGSYLLGLVSAKRLEVINHAELVSRGALFLETLAAIPLYDDRLPNKVYQTETLAMVDYANTVMEEGIGWSALDMGRLFSGLRALAASAPELSAAIQEVVGKWDLQVLAQNGELIGAFQSDDGAQQVQEGRIGYEQYAARAVALWGGDTFAAQNIWDRVKLIRRGAQKIPVDVRSFDTHGAIDPLTGEPFFLHGLEFGMDGALRDITQAVYELQKARSDELGVWVFVSEDHLDGGPQFAYHSIYGNSAYWTVMDEHGGSHPDFATQSMKAIFAWHAIMGDRYSQQALDDLGPQLQTNLGFYAGRYMATEEPNEALTLNTNAVILQSLAYITGGPIHKWKVAHD